MDISQAIVTLIDASLPYVYAGAIIVTFIAIVATGFEVIMNRKDEDKRKEALKSLLYVAIGVVIVVGSLFITRILLTSATNISDTLQSATRK